MGPHLPGLTMAAQKSWKNMGLRAGVADCGKSWKWGYRGRVALGLNPDMAAMQGCDHTALGYSLLPRSLGSKRDLAGKKRSERILTGGP